MKRELKFLLSTSLVCTLLLVTTSNVFASSVNPPVEESMGEIYTFPIKSIETGNNVGTITSDISISKELNGDILNLTISSNVTDTYFNGEVDKNIDENVYTFNGEYLVEVNGKAVSNNENIKYSVSDLELQTLQNWANDVKNGIITHEEYLEKIENSNIRATDTNSISLFGGLDWVTWYQKNNYSGGYDIRAAQMEGYWNGGLNAFMLDPKAVKSGTMLYRHNYLTVINMSAFINKADAISSARSELNIEATALMGYLGVAVLTVTTIIGAAAAAGPAAITAARMISVSNAAHSDIGMAYEYLKTIPNVSPM